MNRLLPFLLVFFVFACKMEEKPRQPDVSLVLQKKSFADIENFEKDRFFEIGGAFEKSCKAIRQKPALFSSSQIKVDAKKMSAICAKFETLSKKDNKSVRKFIVQNFEPYLIYANGSTFGKFTAYYEAELKASKTKHGKYQYPIYGKPNDLVEINLKDFDESLPNKRILGRVENNRLIPYFTRSEIENAGIDAPVILWGDDKVDIFLMQIQGSAVALLDDGTTVRVSYADNNGHRFVGIGSILLQKGLLQKGEASMDKIRDWLKQNPQIADVNMKENPRFIFHKISGQSGPVGALGVPLTEGRSLAVDTDYIPLGSLLFLNTTSPNGKPLQKLVAAQDIGAAIKGPIRGDYFWGHGETALLQAGKMNAQGELYILLPR
ncbi:MAG: MltA domain-containing protein [Alphaproteobacteria bacterium]|nr:MltA domain-containing protein [Alphaproteobacteria bacterium]